MFAKHQPKNGGRNYRLVTKPNRRKVLAKWTRHKKSVEYKDVDDFGKVSPSAFRNVLQLQMINIPQKPAPEIDEEKLAAARSYVRGTGLQITPVWRTFLCNILFQEHVPIPIIAQHSISISISSSIVSISRSWLRLMILRSLAEGRELLSKIPILMITISTSTYFH